MQNSGEKNRTSNKKKKRSKEVTVRMRAGEICKSDGGRERRTPWPAMAMASSSRSESLYGREGEKALVDDFC